MARLSLSAGLGIGTNFGLSGVPPAPEPPPVGGFKPTDITSCMLWLDADDATTFSFSSGNVVSQWRDKSVNAFHFVHTTVNNGPTRNGVQNGKTTIVLDAAGGKCLSRTTAVSTAVDNITVFVVYKRTGGNPQDGTMFANGSPSDGYAVSARAYGGNFPGFLLGGVNWYALNIGDNSTAPWQIQMLGRFSGTWVGYINGVAGTYNAVAGAPSVASAQATITNGAHLFSGEVAEIIHYNKVLSTIERKQVEDYLNAKWAVYTPEIPPSVPDLVGWWDANDASTFTFHSGIVVSQWRDKSGSAAHASQSDAVNAPTRVLNNINGLPAVRITSKGLQTLSPSNTKPVTIFAVIRFASVGGIYILGTAANVDADGGLGLTTSSGALQLAKRNISLIGTSSPTLVDGQLALVEFTYDAVGAFAFYRDGVSIGSGINNHTLVAGVNYGFGGPFGNLVNTPLGGDIAEIIKYNRVLTTPERQQIEAYLKPKWGIA